MARRVEQSGIGFNDMLEVVEAVGNDHGVRIRISIVPLPRGRSKQQWALLATIYASNGRKLSDIPAEQLLWPSVAHKRFEGAVVYLCHKLDAALDEWEAAKAHDLATLPEGALTPLEQYIAGC